jgi:hypothetical protein
MTGQAPTGTAWDERLSVPPWYWPVGLAVSVLLAAAVHSGYDGVRSWLPYLLLPGTAMALLARSSSGRVRVVAGVLHVPGARVPLAVVGAVRPLTAEETRRLRGPGADLRAYVATRAWLRRAVQLRLEDPDDDTPYWLVGTRRPTELAAALTAARGDRNDP